MPGGLAWWRRGLRVTASDLGRQSAGGGELNNLKALAALAALANTAQPTQTMSCSIDYAAQLALRSSAREHSVLGLSALWFTLPPSHASSALPSSSERAVSASVCPATRVPATRPPPRTLAHAGWPTPAAFSSDCPSPPAKAMP